MGKVFRAGETVFIGLSGEINAREVRIDAAPLLDKWPEASPELWICRPGDEAAYPVPVSVEGSVLVWQVGAADTEKAGYGRYEIQMANASQPMLGKGASGALYCARALTSGDGTVPEPAKSWVQSVLEAAERAEDAAERAENAGGTGSAGGTGGGAGAVTSRYAQPDWGAERVNVVYMPETTFELTDMGDGLMMGALAAALPYEFVVGNAYEVTYNGVEYSCECYFGDDGSGSGSGTYVLGNAQVMGIEGAPESDAPFMFGYFKGEDMIDSMGGIYGMIIPLDGAASVTLSIAGEATLMHEIPAAYVEPAPAPPLIVTVSLVDGTTTAQSSHSAAEIIRAIESGRTVYVRSAHFMYGFSYFDEYEPGAAEVFFTGMTFQGGSSPTMATVQISDTSTGTQVRIATQNWGGS